jgi:hypothetical protein
MHGLLPVILLSFWSLYATTITASGDQRPLHIDCLGNTSHPRGSAFHGILDALLASLPAAAAASSGFATDTIGSAAPAQAYGLAQCRACLDAAAREVAAECPGRQTAVVIRDSCLLRYSNASFFEVADRSYEVKMCSVGASQPNGFGPRLTGLMSSLAFTAAYGSPRLFAAGQVRVAPEVTLYGMVQCTRDLADDDCSLCLSSVLLNMPYYCDQMLFFCCSIRHEVYPFFDNQAVEAPMS